MSRALPAYRSPEARERALDELTRRAKGDVVTLGASFEGRPIRAAKLGRPGGPRVLITANIHGVEYIATECALGALEALTPSHRLPSKAEVWVIPTLNPDGYARTWELGGEATLKQVRCNARGVDLNRNYPRPGSPPRWALGLGGWGTGSQDPESPFYRGDQPLSEPETRALATLMARGGFVGSTNLHSTMGTLFPAHVQDPASFEIYKSLCRVFRRAQREPYTRLAHRTFDWFTGEQEDYQHHQHGCWSVCVEHWPWWARAGRRFETIFDRFNPLSPEVWVSNDVPGILSYLEATLEHA